MQKYLSLILSSLFSACVAILVFAYLFPRETIIIEKQISPQRTVSLSNPNTQINSTNRSFSPTNDFITAAAKTKESVVYIRTITKENNNNIYDEDVSTSSGSGVLISSDGYIATNEHVIAKAKQIVVTLNNNREFKAEIIGTDLSTDLALIKIESDNLPFINFGDSDHLQVGEWVLAVGNPFRLQSTVTAGIVSAKARNINVLQGNTSIESLIQTDAAVNPGNSGGALVNTRAELVGINAAIMSKSGGYEGFSFAIPSNLVKKVIYDIKEYGAVQRGWLGVEIHNLTAEESDRLGLDFVHGVYIDVVNKGGAAQQAQLKRGDVVVALNGIQTLKVPTFTEQIGRLRPGDTVKITFYRNKKKRNVQVTLRNQINTTDYIAVRKDQILMDLGIEIRDLSADQKKQLDTQGVYVVSVSKSGTLGKTQMAPGFILNKINNITVKSVDEVVNFLKANKGTIVMEGIYESYPGIYPYTFINE